MNIVITGVAGFVGSNLAKVLLDSGHQVTGIDNFSYGSVANMQLFKEHKSFTFIEGDVVDMNTIKSIKGEVLVHLASQKIPRYTNALRTLDENSSMLRNVVKKCIDDKIKLVFASTSDIYGKNPEVPYREESNSVLGHTKVKRWAYALSKIYSEQYIIANNDEYGLEYTIMRFFGSYGPNQNKTWWGGPQSVFMQNIIENKPLEVHGDGKQTRTFTYIEDTVQGVVKCIFEKNSKNEIFNIANNPQEEINIYELARLIWKMMKGEHSTPDIRLIPYNTFGNYEDVQRRVPDISKIKTMLGFNPGFTLEQGLSKTIEWQIKNQ